MFPQRRRFVSHVPNTQWMRYTCFRSAAMNADSVGVAGDDVGVHLLPHAQRFVAHTLPRRQPRGRDCGCTGRSRRCRRGCGPSCEARGRTRRRQRPQDVRQPFAAPVRMPVNGEAVTGDVRSARTSEARRHPRPAQPARASVANAALPEPLCRIVTGQMNGPRRVDRRGPLSRRGLCRDLLDGDAQGRGLVNEIVGDA